MTPPSATTPTGTLLFHAPDGLELVSSFAHVVFNLTTASLDVLQGRFLGDGDFSAAPNLAGNVGVPAGMQKGALAVEIQGLPGGTVWTSGFARAAPLPFTVVANQSSNVAFSVVFTDSDNSPRVKVAVTVGWSAAAPRQVSLTTAVTAVSTFSPSLVALRLLWSPPNVVSWYERGVRQGMNMPAPYISTSNALSRLYCVGDGTQGGVEVLPQTASGARTLFNSSSYLYAGSPTLNTACGVAYALWGQPVPYDSWGIGFNTSDTVSVPAGAAAAPLYLALYPNDWPFPTSDVSYPLPSAVNATDLRTALTGVHGAVVAALHSYDFFPQVRAAPCLVIADAQCYAPMYNFYDPDSYISNTAMLYSFDADVVGQVRGELETNMAFVCPDDSDTARCHAGQCIHHFVDTCDGSPSCVCSNGSCYVYSAISGATQSGPNVFTLMAALRYAGTTGDVQWLAGRMPTLRAMMGFLDALFDDAVGLYSVPGSLQIDVFIRVNYTADTNAMAVILCELFADAETALGNSTGAAFYSARATRVRTAMNTYLLAAGADHYCTQSDPEAGGGVAVCTRDFVDYDANLIAVAAGVPLSSDSANRVLARVDSGNCTHTGRATYVSEKYYDEANCVGGNTGDSAVTMGRIAMQDAWARHAVGDAAAAAAFEDLILARLQADLLARTWLPERYTCEGQDTHNEYYFEYPAVVGILLFEVRYGIQLQLTKVTVDPLTARNFDVALGQLWIGYYNGTAFHAQLPDGHTGTRAFTVTRMTPGSYTVAQPHVSTQVSVGPDGVLQFNATVGAGMYVDATLV